MKSIEREISEINQRDKSVDFGENIEQENNGCKTSSNQSIETMVMTDESIIKKPTVEGLLFFCDMCNYKCKNKKTIVKHIKSKHENYKQCNLCGRKLINEDSLECRTKKDHESGHEVEDENEHDTSFVFSESMLDEFIDRDI